MMRAVDSVRIRRTRADPEPLPARLTKLSTVVDEAVRGKPSIITRHGKREAVLLSYEEWQRLSQVPTFGRLLMSAPLEEDDVPARSKAPLRDAAL